MELKKKKGIAERCVFCRGVWLLRGEADRAGNPQADYQALSHVAQVLVADMAQSNRPLKAPMEMVVRTALDNSSCQASCQQEKKNAAFDTFCPISPFLHYALTPNMYFQRKTV